MFRHNLCGKLLNLRVYDSYCPFLIFSSRISNSTDASSFTVSYLINTFGLSEKSALLAAKHVNVVSTRKSNLVLETFRSYGFTSDQIAHLITKIPRLLSSDAVKTIKPKLDFYKSIGLSDVDLSSLICKNGYLLSRGLNTGTIPSYNYIRKYIPSNEDFIGCVRKSSWFLHCNIERLMEPNIVLLRNIGISEPRISKFVTKNLRRMCTKSFKVKEHIDLIIKMGIDPSSPMFLIALKVMLHLNNSSWQRRVDYYKSLGWSEDQVISAFKKHPFCVLLSETKIKKALNFFLNSYGMKAADLCACPVLLSLSLDKRILPRHMVIKELSSRGFLTKNLQAGTIFIISEKRFLEKYVEKYEKGITGLLAAYQAKVHSLELEV